MFLLKSMGKPVLQHRWGIPICASLDFFLARYRPPNCELLNVDQQKVLPAYSHAEEKACSLNGRQDDVRKK